MVFVYKTLIIGPTDPLPCSELKAYVMAVTLTVFLRVVTHINNVNYTLIERFQF